MLDQITTLIFVRSADRHLIFLEQNGKKIDRSGSWSQKPCKKGDRMTKKSCRRTMDENKIHEKAVKMRKKTDEQLVHYVEDSDMKAIVLPVMIREE